MITIGFILETQGIAETTRMAITKDDLDSFHTFAEAKIARDGAESLHELVDIWEMARATPERRAHDVAAVQAAIRDLQNGDKGRPARQVIDELRAEISAQRKQ
jgi:hypothetical protein